MKPQLSAKIVEKVLQLQLSDGPREGFQLGERSDKEKTGQVFRLAARWLSANGGSDGQRDAIYAALHEDGYYIRGPRPGSRREGLQHQREAIAKIVL